MKEQLRRISVCMAVFLWMALLGSLLFGCAAKSAKPDEKPTAGPSAKTASEPRPEWTKALPQSTPEGMLYVGSVEGAKSLDEGETAAKNKALSKIAEQFGVTVSSTLDISAEEDTGSGVSRLVVKDKSKVKSMTIEFKTFEIKKRHVEEQAEGEYNVWTLVEVPNSEIARIQKELDWIRRNEKGHVAWLIACDNEALCPNGFVNTIREAATEKGLNLVENPLEKAPTLAEDLRKLGEEKDVAYILTVKLFVDDLMTSGDEHYARVRLVWRRLASENGKVVEEKVYGPVKGGHYTDKAAVNVGFKKILDDLTM